jgi:hypothetical protein
MVVNHEQILQMIKTEATEIHSSKTAFRTDIIR